MGIVDKIVHKLSISGAAPNAFPTPLSTVSFTAIAAPFTAHIIPAPQPTPIGEWHTCISQGFLKLIYLKLEKYCKIIIYINLY